ncbi:hypothetical protein [Desulfitobacterium hafniense]|uniref:hypothetical protein n=1 Tax=Desulfitobacterium hafniense TaxID=49338 RepID=UPI000038AF6E|nr:hypothetical protein [Desulfitobacterium hafniense]
MEKAIPLVDSFTDFEESLKPDSKSKEVESEEVDLGILGSSSDKISDYSYTLIQSGQIYFQVSIDNPLAALCFFGGCLRYASSLYGKMP